MNDESTSIEHKPLRFPVYLAGAVFLAFMVFAVLTAGMNEGLYASYPDSDLISGEWAAQYQSGFEEGLFIREPFTHLWTLFTYLVFREGRPGVVIGEDDWLFTAEEFRFYPNEHNTTRYWLDYIGSVRTRLSRRGIRLVIALVPAKARIQRDRLGAIPLPTHTLPRYERFRQQLLDRGISAPNPESPLRATASKAESEEPFLRTDTHWSPTGAVVAARAIAPSIRAALDAASVAGTRFDRVAREAIEHRGDLLNFIPLGPFMESFGPEPDHVAGFETEMRDSQDVGLFAELDIPITLVGTSYSAGSLWNFAGAVRSEVNADVLNVAVEGRGPFVPMENYLQSDELQDTPPTVVIWEIPERYVPVDFEVEY